MEKEIADLRRRLAHPGNEQTGDREASDEVSPSPEEVFNGRDSATVNRSRPVSVTVEPQPSMATPLTMQRDGSILSQEENYWRLEDVSLSRTRVVRLFDQYGALYLASGTYSLTCSQVLYILPSFSSSFNSTKTARGISESKSSPGMDHHLRCQSAVTNRAGSFECPFWAV